MNTVHLLPDDIRFTVEPDTTISDALQKAGIAITHPCGKKGTCARCLVYVEDKPVKACVTYIDRDMEVIVPNNIRTKGQRVLTDISLYNPGDNVMPVCVSLKAKLPPPALDDPSSDSKRLVREISALTGVSKSKIWIERSVLERLPDELRANGFAIPVVLFYEKGGVSVIGISDNVYGIAVDIGTTTIAAALCDLATGKVLETVGIANPQAEHGADVISRIVYTEENPKGAQKLREEVTEALTECVLELAKKRAVPLAKIFVMTVAANTVMSHFFLGLKTDYLRREPYVPVACQYPVGNFSELGFSKLGGGYGNRVIVLPSISSYVGGDIVAGIVATDFGKKEGLNLLVDVGTNGEMVLAGDGFMVACSCSAGPAFEGSGISCGSRAIEGAINHVDVKDGKLVYDVIGDDAMPASVCGTGLISLISALLKIGAINRQGKFVNSEKLYNLTEHMAVEEADVLNLIRAKGAIFAGMSVMMRYMEMGVTDLDHIYIAGGFGKSIDIDDTVSIGMLPRLKGKDAYSYIGNSSLVGALRVLNDRTIDLNGTAESVLNLELSIGNDFMDEFVKACFLPHTELKFFED